MGPKIWVDVNAHDMLSIRAGSPIKIPARITGRPVPKVTWEFIGPAKTVKKDRLHTVPVEAQVRSFFHNYLLYCSYFHSNCMYMHAFIG